MYDQITLLIPSERDDKWPPISGANTLSHATFVLRRLLTTVNNATTRNPFNRFLAYSRSSQITGYLRIYTYLRHGHPGWCTFFRT